MSKTEDKDNGRLRILPTTAVRSPRSCDSIDESVVSREEPNDCHHQPVSLKPASRAPRKNWNAASWPVNRRVLSDEFESDASDLTAIASRAAARPAN